MVDKSTAVTAILGAGLIIGVLDLLDSIVVSALAGVTATHVLQFIASGLLGAPAFQGGSATAMLGLIMHFAISLVVAAVYWTAAQPLVALRRHPWVFGPLYGCAVFLFMTFVMLPLSAGIQPPLSLGVFLHGIIKHALLVGMPIALITARSEPVTATAG